MKHKLTYMTIMTGFLLLLVACDDYVQNIEPLIDSIEDDRLTSASQIPFLIKGVKEGFALCQDQVLMLSDGLADEFIFDSRVPNATYPTFLDIDLGEIEYDNNSVDNAYNPLGEARFFADDLIRRVGEADVTDQNLLNEALFNANLFGGLTRYLYATYFGLNIDEGGGVIDNGAFIPSDEMYDLAAEKLLAALQYTDFNYGNDPVINDQDHAVRIVNSLLARLYLFKEDYTAAATYVVNGLQSGDVPFLTLHFLGDGTVGGPDNFYYQQAGPPRSQFVTDFRFHGYVEADPTEAGRIALGERLGSDSTMFYYQAKYPIEDDPIATMSWQENHLMRAELILRGQLAGDALVLVNEVRASHGVTLLGSIDLAGLEIERDKELFCTGTRLPDQRRFGSFHLAADKWQYLPITQDERNENPNL